MPALQDLKALDLANAQVTLWSVKGPSGPAAAAPGYSGRWVDTTVRAAVQKSATVAAA